MMTFTATSEINMKIKHTLSTIAFSLSVCIAKPALASDLTETVISIFGQAISNIIKKPKPVSTPTNYEYQSDNEAEIAYEMELQELQYQAQRGNAEAQNELGSLYFQEDDYHQAVSWWKKAAAQGYADSQYNMGLMHYYGYGVRQSYTEAMSWYQKALSQGLPAAAYSIGALYHNGEGVNQNFSTAKEWYGKACDLGSQDGCDQYKELSHQVFDEHNTKSHYGDNERPVQIIRDIIDARLTDGHDALDTIRHYASPSFENILLRDMGAPDREFYCESTEHLFGQDYDEYTINNTLSIKTTNDTTVQVSYKVVPSAATDRSTYKFVKIDNQYYIDDIIIRDGSLKSILDQCTKKRRW